MLGKKWKVGLGFGAEGEFECPLSFMWEDKLLQKPFEILHFDFWSLRYSDALLFKELENFVILFSD